MLRARVGSQCAEADGLAAQRARASPLCASFQMLTAWGGGGGKD